MSYSSSITIEELDANQKTSRTLTLRGPGLPLMGANWGFENVVPTTWYPGNPVDATQQVLVAKEIPSEWSGDWRYTMLLRRPCSYSDVDTGDVPELTSPGQLVDLFEYLGRRGQLLRVTWSVTADDVNIARTVIRLGRMMRFNAKYTRSVDIEWTCSFSWKSRGGQVSRVASTRGATISGSQSQLVAATNNLQSLITNAPYLSSDPTIQGSANFFTLGQAEQFTGGPSLLVEEITASIGLTITNLQNVAGIIAETGTIPYQIASTAIGLSKVIVDNSNDTLDEISSIPIELQTASINVGDLCRAASFFGQVGDATAAAAVAGASAQVQLRDTLTSNPGGGEVSRNVTSAGQVGQAIGLRITRVGDTPQSVSRMFYGTVDGDVDILRANFLPWYQPSFAPGTILLIPQRNTNKGA